MSVTPSRAHRSFKITRPVDQCLAYATLADSRTNTRWIINFQMMAAKYPPFATQGSLSIFLSATDIASTENLSRI